MEQATTVSSETGKIQTTVTYDTSFYIHILIIKKDNSKEEIVSDELKVSKSQSTQETE